MTQEDTVQRAIFFLCLITPQGLRPWMKSLTTSSTKILVKLVLDLEAIFLRLEKLTLHLWQNQRWTFSTVSRLIDLRLRVLQPFLTKSPPQDEHCFFWHIASDD